MPRLLSTTAQFKADCHAGKVFTVEFVHPVIVRGNVGVTVLRGAPDLRTPMRVGKTLVVFRKGNGDLSECPLTKDVSIERREDGAYLFYAWEATASSPRERVLNRIYHPGNIVEALEAKARG